MKGPVVMLTTNLARGGAETQVAQLAIGLGRRGWQVSVVSLLPPSAFQVALAACGIEVHSLELPGIAGVPKLIGFLRRLRPGILHAHMFHANVLARLVRTLYPVPVVISTLHSAAESARKSRSTRRRDWTYRITDPLCDWTVAVSEAVAERHVRARAVRESKLRVIPNGIDTSRYRPDPEERARVRGELGLGDDFVWLAVGRLMWKKDYGTLFRALPGGVLLVAGSGPDEKELRASAPGNVRFLGQRDDVAALMAAADALVLSSVVEGLPLALLEAAASGLPIVATDVGGVKEVVQDYLVPPGDPVALGEAMQRLMALPAADRVDLGCRARERVIARYDIERVVTEWEELYGRY
jgi:glycosyltransferase involved in cell wall biosynthesis